jgi:hypothetical protein
LHAGLFRLTQQTVNNRLRRIGGGKHPAVSFRLQFHSSGFEPFDGVARLESLEEPDQLAFPAWKSRAQLPRLKAAMRDVAPATTGDAHFGQELWSFLQQNDVCRRAFGAGNRCKETRCSASDNDYRWLAAGIHALA